MIRFLQTPGPVKKVVLGGLLTIICVLMVITLVPGFGSSNFFGGAPARGIVATVAGEDVTALEVQREARGMLRQQFPRGGGMSDQLLPFFASRAAEQMINEKAILSEADRIGFRATPEEVRDELQHGPYAGTFFPGGNFIGEDAYENLLQRNDLTVPQFEEQVREQILFNKLRTLITGSATVTDADVRQEFEKRNTKVKFDYAVLKKDDLQKSIQPSEAELKAFYDKNKANYTNSIPEKRKVSYVVVDTSKVQATIPVTTQELQAYYDQHRDEYRVPEQVNVRHILIKTPLPGPDGKVDPKGADAAKAKAEDIAKQLKAGAKFEDLAKKYSEDDDSKNNGGSLGWIQHGRFPSQDMDKAAFSLPKGGTSDVINAGYGFDILHIDDKQPAHVKNFDEVKSDIEPVVKQNKAAHSVEVLANTVLSQAKTDGLEKAAAAKGLPVINTDFISRTDALPGVGNSSQLMDAIFTAKEKAAPDESQIPQGYAIYQVQAVKPPATPTFEDIRSRVETEFKNERSGLLLQQKTQELSDRAKASHDLKKAAKELGATIKTSELVLPDGQVPDIGSMTGPASVAFTMKPGEISGPIDSGNNGVVLSLTEKQQPSDQDFASKKDEIRESLVAAKQGEMFNLFVGNLRQQLEKSGKIRINQDELKQLTRGQGVPDQGE